MTAWAMARRRSATLPRPPQRDRDESHRRARPALAEQAVIGRDDHRRHRVPAERGVVGQEDDRLAARRQLHRPATMGCESSSPAWARARRSSAPSACRRRPTRLLSVPTRNVVAARRSSTPERIARRGPAHHAQLDRAIAGREPVAAPGARRSPSGGPTPGMQPCARPEWPRA